MKKLSFLSAFFIFLVLFIPLSALADDVPVTGDWEVELSTDCSRLTSSGGTAKVYLDVTNTSATKSINFVSIDFAPGRASQQSLSNPTSIPTNSSKRITFYVDIDPEDINSSVQIQVGMSQGTETQVDGWGFINGVNIDKPNYMIAIRITGSDSEVEQGSDIDIPIRITYMGNQNVRLSVFDLDGNYVSSYDNVVPDDIITDVISYTNLQETTTLHYYVRVYTMDGVGTAVNGIRSNEITITVNPRQIDCNFDVLLSANKTTVNAGEDVNFNIQITNTGDTLHAIELLDMDAMSLGNYEGIASGSTVNLSVTERIEESCDISYVVAGIIDDTQKYKQTNIIHINVAEETEPTDEASPSPTSDAVSPTPLIATSEPAVSDDSIESDTEIDTNTSSNNSIDENSESTKNNTWLFVLLIIICILLIAGIILIIMLIKKNGNDNYKHTPSN